MLECWKDQTEKYESLQKCVEVFLRKHNPIVHYLQFLKTS